jgi:hypothetical protein
MRAEWQTCIVQKSKGLHGAYVIMATDIRSICKEQRYNFSMTVERSFHQCTPASLYYDTHVRLLVKRLKGERWKIDKRGKKSKR